MFAIFYCTTNSQLIQTFQGLRSVLVKLPRHPCHHFGHRLGPVHPPHDGGQVPPPKQRREAGRRRQEGLDHQVILKT